MGGRFSAQVASPARPRALFAHGTEPEPEPGPPLQRRPCHAHRALGHEGTRSPRPPSRGDRGGGSRLRGHVRVRVDASRGLGLRHLPRVPVRAAPRDGSLHRLPPPLAQSRGVGRVRVDTCAASPFLPRVPPRAPPLDAGSGARPGARGRAPSHVAPVRVAGQRGPVLGPADPGAREVRGGTGGRAVDPAVPSAAGSFARRGCSLQAMPSSARSRR